MTVPDSPPSGVFALNEGLGITLNSCGSEDVTGDVIYAKNSFVTINSFFTFLVRGKTTGAGVHGYLYFDGSSVVLSSCRWAASESGSNSANWFPIVALNNSQILLAETGLPTATNPAQIGAPNLQAGAVLLQADINGFAFTNSAGNTTKVGTQVLSEVASVVVGGLPGDMMAGRAFNEGLIFLGTSTNQYIRFDGSNFVLVGGGVSHGKLRISGAPTPVLSGWTGLGTGSAALEAGSNDAAGVIVLSPAGTPGTSGSGTVTFGAGYSGNLPVVLLVAQDGSANWNSRVIVRTTSAGLASFAVHWDDNGVSLAAGFTYKIAYWVVGK